MYVFISVGIMHAVYRHPFVAIHYGKLRGKYFLRRFSFLHIQILHH